MGHFLIVMLNVIVLSIVMLSVVMLNVVMLNVAAPQPTNKTIRNVRWPFKSAYSLRQKGAEL